MKKDEALNPMHTRKFGTLCVPKTANPVTNLVQQLRGRLRRRWRWIIWHVVPNPLNFYVNHMKKVSDPFFAVWA